jgi:hypothetical protein
MGIEQAFTDQTLLDVVSLLSARNESGRLKFAGGTMRGAFFFSNGKLVDAHLGPFSGFQAVNLAISVGKASLSFDPSIESHSSSFKVPAERLLLKERFGIETAGIETSKAETSKAEVPGKVEKVLTTTPLRSGVDRHVSPVADHLQPDPSPETRLLSPDNRQPPRPLAQPLPEQVETKTSAPLQETETTTAPKGSPEEFLQRVITDSSARRNRVLLMCLVFLVIIPTTVGLASYWSNGSESTVPKFEAAKTPETLPAPEAVTAPSQPVETPTKTLPTDEPIPLRTQPSLVTAETPTQKTEAERLDPTPGKENEPAKVTPDPPAAPSEPSAKPSSRTIAVVVEIEEGRVTEAFIQQPRRELAAYEAAALRLARQRRFPKGTTRRETINLPVTREQ